MRPSLTLRSPRFPRRCVYLSHLRTICGIVSGPYPVGYRFVVTSGTPRWNRKAFRPILPVLIYVSSELRTLVSLSWSARGKPFLGLGSRSKRSAGCTRVGRFDIAVCFSLRLRIFHCRSSATSVLSSCHPSAASSAALSCSYFLAQSVLRRPLFVKGIIVITFTAKKAQKIATRKGTEPLYKFTKRLTQTPTFSQASILFSRSY